MSEQQDQQPFPGPQSPSPQSPSPQAPAPQYGQQQYMPPAGAPSQTDDEYTGFSVGAVVAVVGAVLTLISYPMVWYVAEFDHGATITGFGSVTNTDRFMITDVSMGKLHWIAGAAMIGMIVLAAMRLAGKFKTDYKRIVAIFGALAVVATVLKLLTVDSGFEASTGLYLAVAGSVIAAAGGAVMAFANK